MDYQNWSKKKFWVIIVVVLFIGMALSPKKETIREIVKEVPTDKIVVKEVIKEVPVEKIVVKEVSTECDYSNWKALKVIDDEGFNLASIGMGLCSQGFDAASKLDTVEMQKIANKMGVNSDSISKLAIRRQSLLKLLGY